MSVSRGSGAPECGPAGVATGTCTSGTAPRDTRRRHGPMKISSSGSTAARRSTLAPLSRVPDSESRSSSSTPVSTARSHACLRATRHGQCAARKAPRVPPAPATAGSSARRGIGKVQFNIQHGITPGCAAHARQRRPTIGTRGRGRGPTPPPGQGRRPGTRCPDAGSGNAASSRSRPRRARSARPGSCADTMRGVTKIASSVSRN